MRILQGLCVAVLICGFLTVAGADPIYEVDYADYDVTVKDHKGVVTDATDFGFWTGANILYAKRGTSKVTIPFRRIRSLEVGKYEPVNGHSPATVTTRKGKAYKIQIERFEGRRYLGGSTDFGTFRIRLADIARLDLKKLSHTESDSGSQ